MKKSVTSFLFIVVVYLSTTVPILAQSYSGGSGTSGDPYQIASKTDLKYLSEHSGEWSKYFIQTVDISFSASDFQVGGDFYNSGNGFKQIGSFTIGFSGVYNGNYHTISGVYIVGADYCIGFFGKISSSQNPAVTNLGLIDVNISNLLFSYTGALAGLVGGGASISNCYSTGTINSGDYAGGLVGDLNASSVTSCYSSVNVRGKSGKSAFGGLIGDAENGSSITNCYATGSVDSSTSSNLGGLVGILANSTVANSYAAGVVAHGSFYGGFIGTTGGSTITNCFYNSDSTNVSTGGTAEPTDSLKTASTFTDRAWDFTNTWQITNANYPTLRVLNNFGSLSATTQAATSIGVASATLNGFVSPHGDTVAVRFIYGTTSGVYTDSVNAVPDTASGNNAISVSASVTGLSSVTTYYYKIVAANTTVYYRGAQQNFTTHKETDNIPGNALSFPGSGNNYVNIPYSSALNPSDNFTIEFWAWCAGGSTYRSPVASENSTGGSHGYYFYADNTNHWASWLGIGAGWAQIIGDTIKDSVWTHLATTYSSGTMKFYINGILQGTQNSVSFQPNTLLGFNIGDLTEVTGIYPFYGKVDEVRFWNIARSEQQIRESMHRTLPNATSNLVAYFQLNEGTGSSTIDYVGSYTGTVTGSSWVASTVPVGTGTSTTQSSFTTGTANLGTVSMTMTNDFDAAIDITGTEITLAPNSTTGISGTPLSNRYWVINAFGTPGTFAGNLTFIVPSTFTLNGAGNTSNYTLYHRSGNDDGNWTAAVTGASNITSTTITFNGVNSFSQFTLGTVEALPVELISFTASSKQNGVELKWKTATENNNYGFEIEKSKKVDGRNETWSKVGFVEGNGNSNSSKSYSFIDASASGKVTYRLKQIDRDGSFKYSSTVEVNISTTPKVFALEQNYPNPFNPSTIINYQLPVNSHVTLKVYDAIGREVTTLVNEVKEVGSYTVQFDGSKLASGIYFARLQSGNDIQLKKMMLLK